jgi:hypothetical protein
LVRVAKLKSLLARIHQSNQQRNADDSHQVMKGHLEMNQELRDRVNKEEAEKHALEEQLRCMAFESAFQTDMELIIEKAAQQIVSQVKVWNQYDLQLDLTCTLEHGRYNGVHTAGTASA